MRGKDKTAVAAKRDKQVERRVRRGIVAGYVHEISARHRHVVVAPQPARA